MASRYILQVRCSAHHNILRIFQPFRKIGKIGPIFLEFLIKLAFKIHFSYAEICAEPSWIDYFDRESVLYAGNTTHEVSTSLYFT